MVELRNQAARGQGFRDGYARGLAHIRGRRGALFRLLDELEKRSEAPYRAAKAELDADSPSASGSRSRSFALALRRSVLPAPAAL
jgi:hypothetical protein